MNYTSPALWVPNLPHLIFSFTSHVPIFPIIFAVFMCLYAIVTGVLVYHWSAYGMGSRGIIVGESLFFAVSLALILVGFTALNLI